MDRSAANNQAMADPTQKPFRLRADQIQPMAMGHGACFASDMITCGGRKVAFMYRAVSDYLSQYAHLVEAWTMLSQDKRTSSGWYFAELSDGSFEVGYYPGGPRFSFSECVQACAEFIVRESHSIAADR